VRSNLQFYVLLVYNQICCSDQDGIKPYENTTHNASGWKSWKIYCLLY